MMERISAFFNIKNWNGKTNVVIKVATFILAGTVILGTMNTAWSFKDQVRKNKEVNVTQDQAIGDLEENYQQIRLKLQKNDSQVDQISDKLDALVGMQEEISNINTNLMQLNVNMNHVRDSIKELNQDVNRIEQNN